MIKDHIRQLMILNEVQVIASRIIRDENQFQEVSQRIEEVRDMIIQEIQPATEQ